MHILLIRSLVIRAAAVALLLFSPLLAQAGYQFGQNKVHYKDFQWSVFQTENFDVYFYPEEEKAAHDAARMAERGYAYLSEALDYEIKNRIPLILYASLNDFQQTNVVGGILGQGTRGVTEGLRNRVILPITGSYRQFNHVLVHELVHAFQFDLMLRSEIANRRFNPPLWFVEGMAEYLSNGMDNVTRMWVRDGLNEKNLLTVKQLNSTYDIRVYRIGQSLWHYLGETHGKQITGKLLKAALRSGSIDLALKETIGISTDSLTGLWHDYAGRQVFPADSNIAFQQPQDIAEKLNKQESFVHRMNLVPALSPDGRQLAYIANKNLNEDIYLLTADGEGNWRDERLLKGGESKRFETLRFFDTAFGWSTDGQKLAFVSKSGKDDALYIMNPHTREVLHQFIFDELNGLLSPTFAPDGKQLAFVGISGGISDLYILTIDDGELTRLTDNRWAELHPQWSPDGEYIAYATDEGAGSNEEHLLFSDYDIAVLRLADRRLEMITELDGNATNPQWLPDGKALAFVSDHQGISNIYRQSLENGELVQLTNLANGVSGITETTPAFSLSADGKVLAFSAFVDGSWNIYRGEIASPQVVVGESTLLSIVSNDSSEQNSALGLQSSPEPDSLILPAIPDPNSVYAGYPLALTDSVKRHSYRNRLKLNGVQVGASVGGLFGSVGAAQFLFSDMLGNHNLFFSTGLRFSDPRHSDFGLTYFNQGSRINYGVQAFQSNYAYTTAFGFNARQFLRNTYRGFNALASYPFSRFTRVEVFGGVTWVDQDLVTEFVQDGRLNEETDDLDIFNFGQVGAAWVTDNTVNGYIGPISGTRSRLSVETTTNDFQFTNLLADYRQYFNVNIRSAVALRVLSGSSVGRDQQIFRLGGPFTFRGADYDEILGSKFVLGNLEYRFPLLFFAPPGADFLSGAAFVDAAAAWGNDIPGVTTEAFQPFTSEGGFRLNNLNAAFGVGARINLGYVALKYDIAWPTDLRDIRKPVGLFSIGTFF